jgi:hypothetical protein
LVFPGVAGFAQKLQNSTARGSSSRTALRLQISSASDYSLRVTKSCRFAVTAKKDMRGIADTVVTPR